MKKVFDIALICVIIIVAFYACSEDYFAPHEENLELNAHDPRLELIAEIDSTKLQESGVETLALGESIVPQDQVKILPIYSGEKLGVQFTVYARIDYHVDSLGIDIKSKQTYLRASGTPYPIWEQTYLRLTHLSEMGGEENKNSRLYFIEVRGILDYSNMYIEGGGHRDQIPPVNQIIQL